MDPREPRISLSPILFILLSAMTFMTVRLAHSAGPQSAATNSDDDLAQAFIEVTRSRVDEALNELETAMLQLGNSASLADIREVRTQLNSGNENDASIKTAKLCVSCACKLRKVNELRSARRLGNLSLEIATTIRKDEPNLYAATASIVGRLELDFEEFEPALNHLRTAVRIIESDQQFDRPISVEVQRDFASAHQKLGHYNAAEEIYNRLLDEVRNNADHHVTTVQQIELDVVALKIQRRELDIARAMLKNHLDEWFHSPSQRVRVEMLRLATKACVADQQFHRAASLAEGLIKISQISDGAQSIGHANDCELLAISRINQLRYDEAVELLTKAADVRANILGNNHPSVWRIHQELDRIETLRQEPLPSSPSFITSGASILINSPFSEPTRQVPLARQC